jgi:hypothetical protein
MARSEAKEWGRAAVIRLALFLAATVLAALAVVFLAVGLVLLLQLLFGSLIAAVFAGFAICAVGAGGLVLAATRRRMTRSIFERTSAEIRKDFESWTKDDE